jgi:hypothetical protein
MLAPLMVSIKFAKTIWFRLRVVSFVAERSQFGTDDNIFDLDRIRDTA